MHVVGIPLDLNSFLHFIFTAFILAFGLLFLVKNTASKYFEVDANFEGSSDRNTMPGLPMDDAVCIVCATSGTKKCSRCKEVRYCSLGCQTKHWQSGHKEKCKVNSVQIATGSCGSKASGFGGKKSNAIALVPVSGSSRLVKHSNKILFPYDEFVKLFNWDKEGCPPCGLLNRGNSCFANAVLQCLAYTRPLVAYLLEKGHRRACTRYDCCFLCAFQIHVERSHQSLNPFSPNRVLSCLPSSGSNLGYGRQEDAHEFMRFAIDTMQSVCLDEFGGEKAVDSSSQETTLIQHIFGGQLQSQVICTQCNKISNQYENMMDLTVEIHGDAESLEECLDQFTVKEWLHGENMYRCDGCNEYVKAWKRLTVRRAPNVLTIALKRFQSGRFGKLNKRVTFPEVLDLSPYMSGTGDGTDIYRLYSVVVHIDMLNASFFGHYICYTKDFRGNWYRIDDSEVTSVELEEVLSQGAYMLLYSRVSARKECPKTIVPSRMEQPTVNMEVQKSPLEQVECASTSASINPNSIYGSIPRNMGSHSNISSCNRKDSSTEKYFDQDMDVVISEASSSVSKAGSGHGKDSLGTKSEAIGEKQMDLDIHNLASSSSVALKFSKDKEDSSFTFTFEALRDDPHKVNISHSSILSPTQNGISICEKVSSVAIDSEHMDSSLSSSTAQDIEFLSNGYTPEISSLDEHACHLVSGFPSTEMSSVCCNGIEAGLKPREFEITDDSSS